jgi:tripartite-type tricarboxylate transporter receptor subunit TctC
VHVPYKGGGPAMQDLMGGVVNLTFLTVLESGSAIKSGKVRPIAVTSSTRSPALPNIPTLAESGVPNYFSISWIGLLAPAGTPKAIVDKISKDVQEIVASPEMKERFIVQGATPVGGTPAQFQQLIDADSARYRKIITEKNISATE